MCSAFPKQKHSNRPHGDKGMENGFYHGSPEIIGQIFTAELGSNTKKKIGMNIGTGSCYAKNGHGPEKCSSSVLH